MGLDTSVSSLLGTYDNCISLLKAWERWGKQYGRHKPAKTSNQQVLLRRSLKKDREKVERAYWTRVSEKGARFEKGDRKALSALGRVIQKLNKAIADLVRPASKSQSPDLDYQSLISRSSSSRSQAIKTFDSLSNRLDRKTPRASVASAASSKSSRTPKTSTSKTPKAVSLSRLSDTSRSRKNERVEERRPPKRHEHAGCKDSRRRGPRRFSEEPRRMGAELATQPLDSVGHRLWRQAETTVDMGEDGNGRPKRFSLCSISSGSERLGEIPERRWHRRYNAMPDGLQEFNTPVMYPVRPYQTQVKERRFLGLFRRGRISSE